MGEGRGGGGEEQEEEMKENYVVLYMYASHDFLRYVHVLIS